MKKALFATAAGAIALGAAVPALGQDKPVGFSLRAGIYFPTDQGVHDPGDAWFGAGADYRLFTVKRSPGLGSHVSISLDYAGKADSHTIPITLNYIQHLHRFYAFAGAGIGFLRDNGDNITSFAYEGGIGIDFAPGPDALFLEAKYLGSSDQNVNGVGVYLGIRF